jgi:hypothetical protein
MLERRSESDLVSAFKAEAVCRSYHRLLTSVPRTVVPSCFAMLAFTATSSSKLKDFTVIVKVLIAALKFVFNRSLAEGVG